MATTTNYGWDTPDDTDLVKDGAAAIRTLGSSVDTTTKNLNPQTTTGALAYRSATANVNTALPIGTTSQVLTVVGGVPAWATPAAASGPAFSAYRATSVQSISAATNTKIQYNTEDFDTDSCYDNTTNYRFTPNKAGKYQVNFVIACQDNGGSGWAYIYKNGSLFKATEYNAASDATIWCSNNVLMDLNGTTDYIEVFVYMDQAQQFKTANGGGHFSAIWIRS